MSRKKNTALIVCPDCEGRGWKLAAVAYPPTVRCERCAGTGYIGLKESIAEAGRS